MCGIFGYIGKRNALKSVLAGIKRLEYRGYDSAGLAGLKDHKLYFWKEVGKVKQLEEALLKQAPLDLELAIAQTRWATHGGVTKSNAHPHLDNQEKIALVHNGIIENYATIKQELIEEGVTFLSETDTEVIVHLIAKYDQGNLLEAVQKAISRLVGAYSIVLIHVDYPDTIVAIAHECPLVIGIGEKEAFIASDYQAFSDYTREVIYLSHSEIALIKADQLAIYNQEKIKIEKPHAFLELAVHEADKGSYNHYTLKEIFEQPQTIAAAMKGRFNLTTGDIFFEDLKLSDQTLNSIERILILGCGTSLHAGYVASYMIEELARLPVQVEISSEYRYKHPVIPKNTLVIAISQSGETADTIAALRELKAHQALTLAICNTYGSTITRECDSCIYLKAGPEIGVCSTKAFTSQLTVLTLFALLLARKKGMTPTASIQFLEALEKIPSQIDAILDEVNKIQEIAEKYAGYQNFFFLGRNYQYPTALEGALKLKEISYINANGYPAGEMKHGPIALINEECPTVALCANQHTYTKIISNLMEVRARRGKIIAISDQSENNLAAITDELIFIPTTLDPLAPILTSVVTQLLAYFIALAKGADIDQPRNLAKSVTVE